MLSTSVLRTLRIASPKRIEHHVAAIALQLTYYNFVRIQQTLRVTPAMAAGVTDCVWEIADIVALLDADERGYKERRKPRLK